MRARRYIIGMTAITAVGLIALLSFFCYERNRYLQYGLMTAGTWNEIIWCSSLIVCVLFLGHLLWSVLFLQKKEKQIDRAEEILAEILEQAGKKEIPERYWKQWKEQCESVQSQGAIGRLQERIWETAQIFRDRENSKRKEQAYLKDLMSDISHQMKTPLAALQVYTDIFEKEMSGKIEKAAELSNQAQKQIERMRWLVTGMLKLAQLESGVMEFNMQDHSILDTLQRSIDSLEIKWREKKLRIVLQKTSEREQEDILIRQDADWLQEAYINLLKNAVEYAPEGSEIIISIEQTSLGVTIAIEDHGEGIPEQELPKVFNRFYRVRKKGQDEGGVGIGLALAKSIVESQGGVITAYSQTGQASYTRFVTTFLTQMGEARTDG